MPRTGQMLILTLLATAATISCRSDDPRPPARAKTLPRAAGVEGAIVGNIVDAAISEASGMAASRRRPDVLWVVNDSGNAAEVYAVTTNGTVLTRHAIAGVRNRDWEDMASFIHEGTPYLLIAETGDNGAKHDTCALYFITEPEIPDEATDPGPPLPVIRQTRFRYEDGARDCESVAVDAAAGKVFLLSKRDRPPVLYELPLHPDDAEAMQVAQRLGEVTTLPAPTAEDLQDPFGAVWSQPTAMDFTPEGRIAVVLTYKNAYLYRREAGQAWLEALAQTPRVILLPHPGTEIMRKRESICFSRDADTVFVTSEGQPSPLFRQDGLGGE